MINLFTYVCACVCRSFFGTISLHIYSLNGYFMGCQSIGIHLNLGLTLLLAGCKFVFHLKTSVNRTCTTANHSDNSWLHLQENFQTWNILVSHINWAHGNCFKVIRLTGMLNAYFSVHLKFDSPQITGLMTEGTKEIKTKLSLINQNSVFEMIII